MYKAERQKKFHCCFFSASRCRVMGKVGVKIGRLLEGGFNQRNRNVIARRRNDFGIIYHGKST
jgi:hypothetical protein